MMGPLSLKESDIELKNTIPNLIDVGMYVGVGSAIASVSFFWFPLNQIIFSLVLVLKTIRVRFLFSFSF